MTQFFAVILLLLATMPNLAILGSLNDQTLPLTSEPDTIKPDTDGQLLGKKAKILPERSKEALLSREIVLSGVAVSAHCLRGDNVRTAREAHIERRYYAYKNKVPP